MGVTGTWPYLQKLDDEQTANNLKPLLTSADSLSDAVLKAVHRSPYHHYHSDPSLRVLIDGYSVFYPLWLRAVAQNYKHDIPEADDPDWTRSRKEARKAARNDFQRWVQQELTKLYEDYTGEHYDSAFSIECYWDRKDGRTPPAKAEIHAERRRIAANRAKATEKCLEDLRESLYYGNRMPFPLVRKLQSKVESVMGNAVPHSDEAWWTSFDRDETQNFIERNLDGMTFEGDASQIRHILCIDEADLSIARRADHLRGHSGVETCFISGDSDLLYLAEANDLFVRATKDLDRFEVVDKVLLHRLNGWVSAEKQRVLGLVVGQDYTGRGLPNLGLATAIPQLQELPEPPLTPRQRQSEDPFPTPGERRSQDLNLFSQLSKSTQYDEYLQNRIEWDPASHARIREAIRIWSKRSHEVW